MSRRSDPVLILLLGLGACAVVASAFVPFDEFIHRGDDAYYYFQVAVNFARYGFWTFDGVNPTNGVQPLWAWLLTGVAWLAHAVTMPDKVALSRLFTALAALAHVGSAALLFYLLARVVSVGTATVAAGALIFSIGTIWVHTWGLENSLYSLLLVGTVAYGHFRVTPTPTVRTALIWGALIGITGLARLNAVLLAGFAPAFFLWSHYRQLRGRAVVLAAAIGLSAAAVLAPYVAWNYATTGHAMPVSGAVKAVQTSEYLSKLRLPSRWSHWYVRSIIRENRGILLQFVSGPTADALWPVGTRIVYRDQQRIGWRAPALLGGCLLILLVRRGGRRMLASRIRALSPFTYVLAFAASNAALSLVLYPTQVRYAMTRWWLVETELVVTVLTAAVVAAMLAYLAHVTSLDRYRVSLRRGAVAVMVAFSAVQTTTFYWDGRYQVRDWNSSWNDHSLRAAQWLGRCASPDARVGSWNAGVLGYHAVQRVTNLDGLINSFELIPYLEQDRLAEYIRAQGIHYLSDAESMMTRSRLLEQLDAREVYRERMPLIGQDYRIYQVSTDLPRRPSPLDNSQAGCG